MEKWLSIIWNMLLVFSSTVFSIFGAENKSVGSCPLKDPYLHLEKRLRNYQTLKEKQVKAAC